MNELEYGGGVSVLALEGECYKQYACLTEVDFFH